MILGSALSAFLGRHISASPFLSISSLALTPYSSALPFGRLNIYIPRGNAAKSHVVLWQSESLLCRATVDKDKGEVIVRGLRFDPTLPTAPSEEIL